MGTTVIGKRHHIHSLFRGICDVCSAREQRSCAHPQSRLCYFSLLYISKPILHLLSASGTQGCFIRKKEEEEKEEEEVEEEKGGGEGDLEEKEEEEEQDEKEGRRDSREGGGNGKEEGEKQKVEEKEEELEGIRY
jgi:hypothetical protein